MFIFITEYSPKICFHALWKFQSSGNKSMYKYILPDGSALLLLSIGSTDRLKSQTVTDWYTRTLQHIKKPSKTIKENYSQPLSCAVLPRNCHGHPYFLFPPNFRNAKYIPLSTTDLYNFWGCLQLPLQNVWDSKQSNTLYALPKHLSTHTCRHPDRRVFTHSASFEVPLTSKPELLLLCYDTFDLHS